MTRLIRANGFRWDVPLKAYKTDGTGFHGISRQTLIGEADSDQMVNNITRYFEIEPGGHSSLERHAHTHSVVILRGSGTVLLDRDVHPINTHDCVFIGPECLHQFHASSDQPLGFLCIVDRERDRPRPPSADELAALRAIPGLREWVRV